MKGNVQMYPWARQVRHWQIEKDHYNLLRGKWHLQNFAVYLSDNYNCVDNFLLMLKPSYVSEITFRRLISNMLSFPIIIRTCIWTPIDMRAHHNFVVRGSKEQLLWNPSVSHLNSRPRTNHRTSQPNTPIQKPSRNVQWSIKVDWDAFELWLRNQLSL